MISIRFTLLRNLVHKSTYLMYFLFALACTKKGGDDNTYIPGNTTKYSTIDSLVSSISKDTVAMTNYLNLAKTSGDIYAEMKVYEKIGQYYMKNYSFLKAIENHQKYLETAYKFNDTTYIIKALNRVAADYNEISAYNESAEYYYNALLVYNQYNSNGFKNIELDKASTLCGLGSVYLNLNQSDLALVHFNEALKINLKYENKEGQAVNYKKIGRALEKVNDYDSAYYYYHKALEYFIDLNSVSGMSACFNRIGNLYLNTNNYESAKVYLESAYKTLQGTYDIKNWLDACISLGNIYSKLGEFSNAEFYLNEGLEYSMKLNFPEYLERVYLLLSEIHKKEGKTSLALEELILSDQYAASFREKNNVYRIMQSRLEYEKELIEAEKVSLAEQHTIQEEKKQMTINVSAIVIILLISLLFVLLQNHKLRIRRKESLYQLEKEKSDFCLNVSQEFKTPVSIIIGLIDRLNTNTSKEQNNSAEWEILNRQSENLQLLINELSSIANLQEYKSQKKMVYGNIVAYFQYLFECYAVLAENKKTDYLFLSSVKELYIDYIPDYIQIILSSLLGNAIGRCTENDNITVKIDLDKNKKHYLIEVSDTGNSIEIDEINFKDTEQYKFHSGLSITKNLLEKLNGKIDLNNEIDGRTIFNVRIPIININVNQSHDSISIHKSYNLKDSIENNLSKKQDLKDKPIVLIIEDNRDMNYYLTTILKDKYNVIIEANSEKGIITAKNKIPDIIVSDVSLPGMECYRSCKEIKNSHITRHIPIILLTVSDSKEERVKSIKSGADAFLVKPVYEAELTAVIDRLLSTRRQIKDKYSPIKQLNTQGVVYDKGNEANIEFINRVIDLIYKDITNTENIIDNIASEVCLSPSQLNRKIKAITGMTTSNFVLKTRLNRAKKLLTVTQKPIGDIAMECGFNDFAYFSRSFKKEFGMTPTTFQRLPHSAN